MSDVGFLAFQFFPQLFQIHFQISESHVNENLPCINLYGFYIDLVCLCLLIEHKQVKVVNLVKIPFDFTPSINQHVAL